MRRRRTIRSAVEFVTFTAFTALGALGVAAPAAAAQQDAAAGLRQGAIGAVREIARSDPSFSADERRAAEAGLADLREHAATLTDAAFELALARIVALARNGHTQVLPASWQARFPRLGVRFFVAGDGLRVMDAAPEWDRLVGARVAAIEGHDLEALRDAWSRYAPGRVGFRDESLPAFLEAPAMLHAASLAARSDAVTLTLDGGERVEVGTYDGWPTPDGVWALLPAARHVELALSGGVDGEPLYLREPEAFFRFVPLPDRDAVYIQFRGNVDFSGATDMAAEASHALERLRALAPRYVIVDQRFNIGGDLNTTRDLMEGIPEIVGEDGAVFAITSGRTFSAGIASLGYLVQAAEGDVTIVGEPVGDELEFWAEGGPAELPTGTPVLAASERHNYRTGCPEDDCHGSIRNHPIRVDSLEPDVTPSFTWEDVVRGRDPYLEAVFARMAPANAKD
ncbi:MAG TPA: hypothetical protein VK837_01825 [Longimicrobiales bacterium]|nr:hypothetical protein [Longimicrobiales bacterium]